MALDDFFEYLRCAGMVPDAIGIDDGNRTFCTNAETIGFSTLNFTEDFKFGEAFFQVLP